eukprot:EG_transcript_12766
MGGQVSLEHVESGRFLDCNGNASGGAPTTELPKGTRDQWFNLRREGKGILISTDYFPQRRLCVQDGAVQLHRWDKSGQLFQASYVQQGDTPLVRLQCPDGYLAAPAVGGPVTLLRKGDSPLTLWRVIPRDTADLTGAPLAPSPSLERTHSNLLPRSSSTTLERTPSTSAEYMAAGQTVAAIAWQWLRWLGATYLLILKFLWRLVTWTPDSPTAVPVRRPPLPVSSRIQVLSTGVAWPGSPEQVYPHKPTEAEHFVVPEGALLSETLYFKVLKGPVTKLRRRTRTFFKSHLVDEREEPMGTFPASGQEYTFHFPDDPTPTGWFFRGTYRCVAEFIDADGPCCPPWEFQFSIVKAKR